MKLGVFDYAWIVAYLVVVLVVGCFLHRRTRTSGDFFLAGRSIPAWAAALAFISANCGATEMVGIAACGAKYGMLTSHFYWLGAIPAMVFLGLFMMPFYYGSKARSVPEYLRLRFDEKTRALNAISFAVMTVLASGISMYASAKLLGAMLGWGFNASLLISACIVLVYIVMGGLASAMYNEVLQFILIVVGFTPLAVMALADVGWWGGLTSQLDIVAQSQRAAYAPGTWVQMWRPMADASQNSMGIEWFGMVMGLGFVLSFGYWCTDFLVVQRAMAAKSMTAARQTPLLACFPKILFPALVVLPGMIAIALTHQSGTGGFRLPVKDGGYDYDLVIPLMLSHYYPPGLLGLGLVALLASFMSGMAGNVTAFNTVWTCDIYQSYIAPNRPDRHYVWMGRVATVVGIGLSLGAAYLATRFNNLMDLVQLVFGFVNAPLFATFLLGMFWRRTTGHGAFTGLLAGMIAATLHHGLTVSTDATSWLKGGWLGHVHTYGSEMALNFWTAIVSWTTCFGVTILVSVATASTKPDAELRGLVYSLTPRIKDDAAGRWYSRPATLAVIVLAVTVALNVIFW
jgi:SSS family solute:Na+ symporter